MYVVSAASNEKFGLLLPYLDSNVATNCLASDLPSVQISWAPVKLRNGFKTVLVKKLIMDEDELEEERLRNIAPLLLLSSSGGGSITPPVGSLIDDQALHSHGRESVCLTNASTGGGWIAPPVGSESDDKALHSSTGGG